MRNDKTFQNATLTHEIRQRLPQSWDPVDVFPDTSDTMNSFWRDLAKPTQNFLMHVVGDIINRLIDDDYLQQPATDEWVECSFEDIKPGDRVRLVLKNGPLTESPTVIETEPHVAKAHYLGWTRHQTGSTIEAADVQAVYRIPKPVQHPAPAKHPVIYVKECDLVGFIPKIMVWYRDSYVGGHQCLFPEHITDWSPIDPAKVVEDDR